MVKSILIITESRLTIRQKRSTTSKVKTPPIDTKVPPFDRAHQDQSDHTNFNSAKPNPAIENASEILKTRHFPTLAINKGDPAHAFTRHAI